MRKVIASLCLIALAVLGNSALAQNAGVPFAAIQNGNLTLFDANGAMTAISSPANRGFLNLVWSPDGSKIAYIVYDEQYQTRLMVADTASGQATMLDTGPLEAGFPVTFTTEGNILYASPSGDPANPAPEYRVDIKRIQPQAGAQPEIIANVAHGVGCGGGSPMPTDWQYWTETGFGGDPLALAMTSVGLLHSTSCSGVGLALLNLDTNEDTPIGENLGRIAVSPDSTKAAAVRTQFADTGPIRSLVTIDLTTLAVTELQTPAQPDQVAWGADSRLLYSSIERGTAANLFNGLSDEQRQRINTSLGYELPADSVPFNRISIHQFDPASSQDTTIYTGDAFAIGRMRVTADGSALLFSQIPNPDRWIQGLAEGTLDIMADADGRLQRAAVPITLYRLNLDGDGTPALVGEGIEQFSLRP